MTKTIAILAPGAMGSAVARRLGENGARVLTSLKGRSEATLKRAADAGMIGAEDDAIAEADIILSIVPPGEAVALAERLAALIVRREKKPIVVDCNAVNVDTVHRSRRSSARRRRRSSMAASSASRRSPAARARLSTCPASTPGIVAVLKDLGLDVRIVEGPVGAASALKMSYAGIVKGLAGIGSAMVVAATKAGAADALRDELALSQPAVLARLEVALPDMIPKAYRWVAEMREISGFLGPDHPASQIYEGFARWFEHLAADANGEAVDAALLKAFAARVAQKKA